MDPQVKEEWNEKNILCLHKLLKLLPAVSGSAAHRATRLQTSIQHASVVFQDCSQPKTLLQMEWSHTRDQQVDSEMVLVKFDASEFPQLHVVGMTMILSVSEPKPGKNIILQLRHLKTDINRKYISATVLSHVSSINFSATYTKYQQDL